MRLRRVLPDLRTVRGRYLGRVPRALHVTAVPVRCARKRIELWMLRRPELHLRCVRGNRQRALRDLSERALVGACRSLRRNAMRRRRVRTRRALRDADQPHVHQRWLYAAPLPRQSRELHQLRGFRLPAAARLHHRRGLERVLSDGPVLRASGLRAAGSGLQAPDSGLGGCLKAARFAKSTLQSFFHAGTRPLVLRRGSSTLKK